MTTKSIAKKGILLGIILFIGTIITKIKAQIPSDNDKVTESIFIASEFKPDQRRQFYKIKETLVKNGYDSGFFLIHFASMIQADKSIAKDIIESLLSKIEWEDQKIILGDNYLLGKKGLLLILWENKFETCLWIIFLISLVILCLKKTFA